MDSKGRREKKKTARAFGKGSVEEERLIEVCVSLTHTHTCSHDLREQIMFPLMPAQIKSF